MDTINQIISILTVIMPVLITVLQKPLAGLRTKLIAVQTIVTGVWAFLSTSFLPGVCEHVHLFCDFSNGKTFGFITAVVGLIVMFLRKAIGGDANLSELPARLMRKK